MILLACCFLTAAPRSLSVQEKRSIYDQISAADELKKQQTDLTQRLKAELQFYSVEEIERKIKASPAPALPGGKQRHATASPELGLPSLRQAPTECVLHEKAAPTPRLPMSSSHPSGVQALEHQQQTTSTSVKEDKKIIEDIKRLSANKPMIKQFDEAQVSVC